MRRALTIPGATLIGWPGRGEHNFGVGRRNLRLAQSALHLFRSREVVFAVDVGAHVGE